MNEVNTLGYVGFGVQQLERWRTLLVDVIGLQPGLSPDQGQRLVFRMDDQAQRIILESSEEDDIIYVGWMLNTQSELEQYVAHLSSQGIQVEEAHEDLARLRRVERLYACIDPNGVRHEFAFGPAYAAEPFSSPVLRHGFVTGHLGLGHILMVANHYDATRNFASQVLGLRVSDYIRAPLETPQGTLQVDATFFHTVTGRHHSFATAPIPFPKKLHHLMLEVGDFNDVGLAYDRCVAAGFEVAMGLGHHPNDQMFSFYVVSPSGPLIEVGYGGRVIEETNWEVKTYAQLSDWGHTHIS